MFKLQPQRDLKTVGDVINHFSYPILMPKQVKEINEFIENMSSLVNSCLCEFGNCTFLATAFVDIGGDDMKGICCFESHPVNRISSKDIQYIEDMYTQKVVEIRNSLITVGIYYVTYKRYLKNDHRNMVINNFHMMIEKINDFLYSMRMIKARGKQILLRDLKFIDQHHSFVSDSITATTHHIKVLMAKVYTASIKSKAKIIMEASKVMKTKGGAKSSGANKIALNVVNLKNLSYSKCKVLGKLLTKTPVKYPFEGNILEPQMHMEKLKIEPQKYFFKVEEPVPRPRVNRNHNEEKENDEIMQLYEDFILNEQMQKEQAKNYEAKDDYHVDLNAPTNLDQELSKKNFAGVTSLTIDTSNSEDEINETINNIVGGLFTDLTHLSIYNRNSYNRDISFYIKALENIRHQVFDSLQFSHFHIKGKQFAKILNLHSNCKTMTFSSCTFQEADFDEYQIEPILHFSITKLSFENSKDFSYVKLSPMMLALSQNEYLRNSLKVLDLWGANFGIEDKEQVQELAEENGFQLNEILIEVVKDGPWDMDEDDEQWE